MAHCPRQMFNIQLASKSPEDSRQIGLRIGQVCPPAQVIALEGALGAGKTCFAQGFAQGRGIQETISSPSYAIIQEYPGKAGRLIHMDWYRLHSSEEIEDLGIEEYFDGKSILLIEWAQKAPSLIPDNAWKIQIQVLDMGERIIKLEAGRTSPVFPELEQAVYPWIIRTESKKDG